MASIPCSIYYMPSSTTVAASTTTGALKSPFVAVRKSLSFFGGCSRLHGNARRSYARGAAGATALLRFGTNGVDAEGAGIYASQTRDDFSRYDVEQYYEYMGMLAAEGSYAKMEALLDQNIHPVDILLMMAAVEGDQPKIEELIRAGAKYDVKDADGKTALDLAATPEIRNLILGFSLKKA